MFKILPQLKNAIDPLKPEEFEQLKENLLRDGIRDPLVIAVFPDEETGEEIRALADGHNRYLIAQEHGLVFSEVEKSFENINQVLIWMEDNQDGRRNRTDGQRWEGKQRKIQLLKIEGERKRDEAWKLRGNVQQDLLSLNDERSVEEKHDTQEEIAKELGWAKGKVAQAEQIWKSGNTEVIEKVKSGDLTIGGAYKEVKKIEMETRRDVIRQTLEKQEIETGEKKYRVVYADPPWKYSNTMPEYVTDASDYYLLMDTQDICNMPIKQICEDNAVLFLWSTSPHLPEAFEVIKAWGFTYKTTFIWDKIKHNMGHYNSVRHEILLVCTRGACTPDVKKLFDSVVSVERTEHSKKPEVFREIIETLYTFGNKIELFARETPDGWDVFGNQKDKK